MPAYEDAVRAYMAGHKTDAQTLLGKALRANPRDQASWLLLAQCVDVVERKKYCLQQVLLINPKNPEALERLAELEKRPTPAFKTDTLPSDLKSAPSEPAPTATSVSASTPGFTTEPAPEVTSSPAPAPESVIEEPQKPITGPLASTVTSGPVVGKPRKTSTRPLLPSLPSEPVAEEEPKNSSARPFAIPLETTDEPKRPITRPLAAPQEPTPEPKKNPTEPLPPPPPALQEILDARASGGASDETIITPNRAVSDFQPVESDEAFAPLPDEVPAVSSLESSLMDDQSFRPGPFSATEPESAAADSFESASASAKPDSDLQGPAPDSESNTFANDDVTLVGASAPASADVTLITPPAPPRPDKATLRVRLEEAVALLEKDNKTEGTSKLEALLQDDPRNEMGWMWLGVASYDVNRQRECYLRALEINPRNKLARTKLSEAEDRLTAAGIALQPLATPLPPEPNQPVTSSGSGAGVWIGLVLVVLALVIVAFVVFWVVTHR